MVCDFPKTTCSFWYLKCHFIGEFNELDMQNKATQERKSNIGS